MSRQVSIEFKGGLVDGEVRTFSKDALAPFVEIDGPHLSTKDGGAVVKRYRYDLVTGRPMTYRFAHERLEEVTHGLP